MKKVKPEVAIKKEEKKIVIANKPQKIVAKVVKEKKPKIELVTYTVRATIPTGAYSNICPEVVVKAESLEVAERAVMPHIERLFAKYRDTNGQSREIREEPVQLPGQQTLPITVAPIVTNATPSIPVAPTAVSVVPVTPVVPVPQAVLNTSMQRATQAINSCTSIEALELIKKQVANSEKLIDSEKKALIPVLYRKQIDLCTKMEELTTTRKEIESDKRLGVADFSNLQSLCNKKDFELA